MSRVKPESSDPHAIRRDGDQTTDDDAAAYLAAVVESSHAAVVGMTLDGVITRWNQAAKRIFGYEAAEIVGRLGTLLIPGELTGEAEKLLNSVRSGERVVHHETVRLRKDGTRAQVSLTVVPITNRAGGITGVSMLAHDVTDEKRASETLAQLRLAIEAAPNGIVMINPHGEIVMVNSQMERMFGYDRAEMLKQRIELLLPDRHRLAHPEQREDYFHSPEVRAMGHGRDLFARRKDGTEFPVEVGLNPAATPDGPFVLAAVIDITERKRMEAELATVHADLRAHAHTLEALVAERTAHLHQTIAELEGVSYSLTHDLRGPLRTIQGFCQIVLADAADRLEPSEKELLAKSVSAANRLDRLIQDVLTYTRVSRQTFALQPVDVERLVKQIIDERPELQAPAAEIVIEGRLDPVQGHEASLTQVITNLLENAVKFKAPGRASRICVRSERDGTWVRLWFEDNGVGIPRESQAQLFTMFHRVHHDKAYPGTGIGLAIVRKAVERMGGTVRVESEFGVGSRFCVQLSRGEIK